MTWGWGVGGQCILSIFVLTFVEIVKRGGKVSVAALGIHAYLVFSH